MNLLFLNHNVIWRSAFNRCFQLARVLVRQGCQVTLLTNATEERWKWSESMMDGVCVVESPDLFMGALRTGWDPLNVLRRTLWCQKRFSKMKDPFLIHAFDTRPTVVHPALELKRMLGCPLVMDWGDWWGYEGAIRMRKPFWLNFIFEPVETYYEEKFKYEADWLTCVSQPLRQRAQELGFSKNRITVIPNPADPRSIQMLDRAECRRMHGLDPERFYVIFSGYVLYDLEMVFQTMVEIYRTQKNVGLILTGAITDLPEKWKGSFELIQTGTLSREGLNQYLCASNVAMMPLSENIANEARFPGKVGDYLAAGLPVLMNSVGDVARILQEEGIGVFAKYSAMEFSQKLHELKGSPPKADAIGRKGREFAVKKFNWEMEAQRLLAIYQKLKNTGS